MLGKRDMCSSVFQLGLVHLNVPTFHNAMTTRSLDKGMNE